MRQYWEQRQQAADALLLFRMGDFYELFYDDAERAAGLLGITLTSRDNGKTPLAGIPHHALESYLAKLVDAGHKVAISEQIEDARQAKGVVKRAIVRVVTPGTLTDEALLDRDRSNILAAIHASGDQFGVASLELSTGVFIVQCCAASHLLSELARLAPAEVLLADGGQPGRDEHAEQIREQLGCAITYSAAADFAAPRVAEQFQVHFETTGLEGFGFEEIDPALQAAGALLAYVRQTQRAAARHLQPPRRRHAGAFMALDPTTLRSLEVERTLRTGARTGSILAAVDRTRNPMGARLLRNWLCYPLLEPREIAARQRLVEALRNDNDVRQLARTKLREMSDLERVIGRLGVMRITPRDLRAIGDTLAQLPALADALRRLPNDEAAVLAERLVGLEPLAQELCTALAEDAPTAMRDGGIFAAGFDAELDRLRGLTQDGQRWLALYQAEQIERTGIPTLKVGFNKVFGYYLEVTNPHRDRVPADYVRKQTVKNAERYITDALKKHESEALSAESRAKELEYDHFLVLRERTATYIPQLQRCATALAEIDVLAGWAELAVERHYCRPEFVDVPVLEIDAGRHPVVEQLLDRAFVPNDTRLGSIAADGIEASSGTLALITGPNMAGKSTYIRQVAALVLLAHCGCWVPAKRMRLGPVDRVFTRVGAADELARGQSTFMVEMLETANILHNATASSLVILDEVGRGTSTFDGLSLAWAITEHLGTRIGCRTLFATHYHELTELAELLESVFNLNVAVREFEDRIVFLHRIVSGAADMSYGLHVAKLAGVPRAVLERGNAVLNELERTFSRDSQRPVLAAVQRRRSRQLRLFDEPEEVVVRQLRDVDMRQLDAQRAQALIRQWRDVLGLPAVDGPGAASDSHPPTVQP